jgi:hypothetical protein
MSKYSQRAPGLNEKKKMSSVYPNSRLFLFSVRSISKVKTTMLPLDPLQVRNGTVFVLLALMGSIDCHTVGTRKLFAAV